MSSSITKEVNEISCSQNSMDTIKLLRDQIDILLRDNEDLRPPKQAKQNACCKCAYGNNQRQGMGTLPETCRNNFYVKKYTCFQCGTLGHIARNCPNRPYVPYYIQGWQNVPRGRSSKRNPSRSQSHNGQWNMKKANNQNPKDKKGMSDKKQNSRDAYVRSRSFKSKASRRSVSSSKESVEASIRSNKN
ncbi:serine/arginine-rich splicing factor RS2Z32-like [Lactuca sativa]|uniref:serine/arginine-rich splicing factor RS2Z32-like n=1 Tax=Lactuca sativa TaxID=4236 RepID=UPI000CD7F79E|nr:serine/arginine-rich splicing factor RS2Z32-like [Lactuca sativa]